MKWYHTNAAGVGQCRLHGMSEITAAGLQGAGGTDMRQQTHCLAKVDIELAHDHGKDVTTKPLLVQVAKGLAQPAGNVNPSQSEPLTSRMLPGRIRT